MKDKKALEVAVLGSGQMGQNVLRHLEGSPMVRGVTVFDQNPEQREKVKQAFGVKAADTLKDVLENPEIKLV